MNKRNLSYQFFRTGIFILFFFSLILKTGYAQYPGIEKIRVTIPVQEPVFTRAVQDINHFIWLGSDRGLFRFDGISFRHYYPQLDSLEFHISALMVDHDGVIWAGCRDGKIYKVEQGEITLFNPEEGTSGKTITDLVASKEGTLWWSTAGEGIYFFEKGRVININQDDGLKDNYVYDLEIAGNGALLAGTDAGIFSCRYENGRKEIIPLQAENHLPDIIVRVIEEDQEGKLWLGFEDGGAGYLDQNKKSYMQACGGKGWNYGPVQDIVNLSGSTWISTAQGIIVETTGASGADPCRFIAGEEMKFGKINDLLPDLEGNVWILASSGLYRTTGTRIRYFNNSADFPLENIHAIRNDGQTSGILWYSNDNGLFSMDLFSGKIKKYLENFHAQDLKITSLNQDRFGNIWAGTFNYGVFRISPEDGRYQQITEKQGLVNNNVLAIARHEDTLWMATLGGASEVVLRDGKLDNSFIINSFNYKTGLANNFIYSVYEDNHDQIWLATDGDGISVRTKKGWINYDERNGLTDDVIYAITGDSFGNIWAASASKGLFRFSGQKFDHFGLEDGLSSLAISGVAASGDELLILHDNGFDILHIPTGRFAHFGEEAGMEGIFPDLNAISKDKEGNIWLGTRKGIIRYQPANNTSSYSPETVIEDMFIYLEPRQMVEGLELPYKENHVSFKYSGIWFSNPQKVTYQVFLEGYDLGWKDTYDRQMTYSSLSPGEYTFRVRASLGNTFSNASEVSYRFRIREPFWLQDWFMILLIIVLALLIYSLVVYRENRLRVKERAKKEQVEFEFQVLKNQVNPHFLFNSFSTLMSLIEDNPDHALQYTEKLSDFFRTILQFKDQEVIVMEEELSLVENYFFLMKKRYGDNINLDIQRSEKMMQSFIPPMTLQILIENAVKHNVISKDKPLYIKIYEDDGKIVAENNLQPKTTPETSTGIGLENIRKRYRLITKNEILLEKSDLIFKIILPVIT